MNKTYHKKIEHKTFNSRYSIFGRHNSL